MNMIKPGHIRMASQSAAARNLSFPSPESEAYVAKWLNEKVLGVKDDTQFAEVPQQGAKWTHSIDGWDSWG